MWWDGRLAPGLTAKDMMLAMTGRFGMNGADYQAVEFCGPAVQALSMPERMTMSNMSAELGAQTGLIAPDATTRAWLRGVGVADETIETEGWHTDEGAPATTYRFDAATLAPQRNAARFAGSRSPASSQSRSSAYRLAINSTTKPACAGDSSLAS
jgi:3-isopropylmalate/(R)-2-methylmalate dehydratase large subunit